MESALFSVQRRSDGTHADRCRRYMLVIIRGIILKGVGLEVLAEQVVALAVFGVGIMAVAAARFRKRLG